MDPLASLQRLTGPLEFAARDNFAHLHVVKDLERFVQKWAAAATKDRSLPPPFIDQITRLFTGFDALMEVEKKKRLQEALRLLKSPEIHSQEGPVWALTPEELPDETAVRTMLRVLSVSVSQLKGVGPSRLKTLQKMGCATLGDLLYRFPFRYEDRRRQIPIRDLSPGQSAYVIGKLIRLTPKGFGKRSYLEAQVSDGTGTLTLKWFKGVTYFKRQLKVGTAYHLYGEVKRFGFLLEMHHPDMEKVLESTPSERFGTLVPVYPEVSDIGQKPFLKLAREAMKRAGPHLTDPLPAPIREAYHFPPMKKGLEALHATDPNLCVPANLEMARRRFLYETYFFFELFLARKKQNREIVKGVSCPATKEELKSILQRLPFQLTKAQVRTVREIFSDITSGKPMNRLLQGDVGSGKTVVSAITAALYLNHGYQVALMAPTEILAQQHFRTFQSL
ncbi:MAG: DEAD/DEAH box helicase family protein, partial [Deltaproteobacteria bacterium]|nr:DEAD/DEAH box helicase family protein [Deltaproteobacteria bacterium]